MSKNSASRDLVALVLEWAREWGEEDPRDIRWVYATRDEAIRLLHGSVGSTDESTYLVTLRGDFSLVRDSGKSMHGVWAALMVDPTLMQVRTYTVRPSDSIPDMDLSALGEVNTI